MRLLALLSLLVPVACSMATPARVPIEPFRYSALVCQDSKGQFATGCRGDPVETHECRAADPFGRCPGDPVCFSADNTQTPCRIPFDWSETQATGEWRPDATLIARLESRAWLPTREHVLMEYHRQYLGTEVAGRRMVLALYALPDSMSGPAGVQILGTAQEGLIVASGGGCRFVELYFDVATETQVSAFCNGPI